MRRSTRVLLGASIALITAASLHITVGDRFHRGAWGHYRGHGCGHYIWKDRHHDAPKHHEQSQEGPIENSDNQ